MAENISDRNGRALEYLISIEIEKLPNFSLSNQSLALNNRDKQKYDSLPDVLKNSYDLAAIKIASWVSSKFSLSEMVVINRLNDDSSNVADIVFNSQINEIQISLKHNHEALKHPRPYSFAQSCGYMKNSLQDNQHRELMQTAADVFRTSAGSKALFKDCETLLPLYKSVCDACKASLDHWSSLDPNVPSTLFQFLVGTGFYKVIVETRRNQQVKIQDYQTSIVPTGVSSRSIGNRLLLSFNNGWDLDLRIHTASSRISQGNVQLSLKFDAQKTAGNVSEVTL